jgi:hypothetical protein
VVEGGGFPVLLTKPNFNAIVFEIFFAKTSVNQINTTEAMDELNLLFHLLFGLASALFLGNVLNLLFITEWVTNIGVTREAITVNSAVFFLKYL